MNSTGSGSVSSLDDSGLSICGSSSRTSSPHAEDTIRAGAAHNAHSATTMDHGSGMPEMHSMSSGYVSHPQSVESLLHYQQQLQQHLINMQSFSPSAGPVRPSWLDFALYFSRSSGGAAPHPSMNTPMLSPSPLHLTMHPQPHHHHLQSSYPGSAFELASPAISPVSTNQEEKSSSSSTPKCRSFTIDAILGK